MEKRSTGLTVLCILSWVWLAIILYFHLGELMTGQLSQEDIRLQKIAIIESQPEEMLEEGGWMIDDTIRMLEISSENFTLMMTMNSISILLGVIAVMLMFRMRKIGFHLYIIYTLLSVFYWVYFFSGIDFGLFLIGFSISFGGLFVLLYGTQAKRMI